GGRTEPGTTISLFLKDDVEVDLIEELKKYARHVEFPIYVDDGENEETIVEQGYDINFVDYMNPLYKQYADELNPYDIDFEKEGIEGVKGKIFFMFLKDENGSYGFKSKFLSLAKYRDEQLFGKSRFMGGIENENQCILSQDGILIKKIGRYGSYKSILSPWIDTSFIFFDVNLNNESKIDLTIDRNDVVINEKLNNLKTKIDKIIIVHIERIFSNKYLVTDKDKNRFMERFLRTFVEHFYIGSLSDFFLKRMKKLLIFECSVNGATKYLRYNELKDRWKYFYLVKEKSTFRNNTSEDMEKAMENAYPEDPIIYSVFDEKIPELLLIFSGEHIIVTNKESGFSLDKYFLLPSVEKRDKKEKEYGFTFEGDYKDCFGTLTTESFRIEPNFNHPFIRLVNKNRDKFKGEDKKEHEFFIDKLLGMKTLGEYLRPLKEIQEIQKYLLDFYVEKGVLTKEEAERYVLTEKDFCPYDMDEDFLKQ
ncbi:MAG: hypothetical protein KAT65_01020, partial [Methanophagales archaeon]|nr:hypothetical protein [Methanophagales archaeon]